MRRAVLLLCVLVLAGVIAWAAGAVRGDNPRLPLGGDEPRLPLAGPSQVVPPSVAAPRDPAPGSVSLAGPDALRIKLKRPPRAGLLFDLDSGKVLWSRHARSPLPIASLTKIMTAIVVVERTRPRERAKVTRAALGYRGSGVGVLPRGGRSVPVEGLLAGLLLVSGNDAAIALADHVSGSERRFVAAMNRKARALGLRCTQFVSPSGLEGANRSCAADVAALARAAMAKPRIARLARRRQAAVPFPIRGGRLWLNNTNPLLRTRYRGTLRLKTGSSDEAGHSFVGVVRRRRRTLGVVLLDSPDPGRQARRLLDRAFRRPATP